MARQTCAFTNARVDVRPCIRQVVFQRLHVLIQSTSCHEILVDFTDLFIINYQIYATYAYTEI